MAVTIRQCAGCKNQRITSLVTFKANVSLFVRRYETNITGHLCFSCMTGKFLSFEITTLLGTWWGIVGMVKGPFFILHNLAEYIEGGIGIARAKGRAKLEGVVTLETQTAINATSNYVGIGKALGAIFVKPDVWRDINRLRGYQVPEPVVNYEAAFARVAIIRETIRQQKTGVIATQMLAGIDQYLIETLKLERGQQVLDHYKNVPLCAAASRAVQSYECNVFPLTELAFIFARRLSIVSLSANEIAALFDEVKAEAEKLLRLSASMEETARLLPASRTYGVDSQNS